MDRDFNKLFMQVAELYSEFATCAKIKVGAVITKDKRIISTGYNGVPSGQKHCCDHFDEVYQVNAKRLMTKKKYLASKEFLDLHRDFSDNHENHAESNAILFAKQDLTGCEIYVTYSPCTYCAKMIVTSGISKVYYKHIYGNGSGIKILTTNGIDVRNIRC